MMSAFLVDGARQVSAPALLVRGLLSDIVSEETVKDFLTLVSPRKPLTCQARATWLLATTTTHSRRRSSTFSTVPFDASRRAAREIPVRHPFCSYAN